MKSYAAGICRHQKFEKCFINEHTPHNYDGMSERERERGREEGRERGKMNIMIWNGTPTSTYDNIQILILLHD